MILKKFYDEKTHTQKIWYDSSMIFYSEMVENETSNSGNLFITFKNGSKYVYKNVMFEDYLVFIAGGTDVSQGKTLNKVIKSKYDYEKLEDSNLDELRDEMNKLDMVSADKNITYFISGHRDITQSEFEFNYEPLINRALSQTEGAKFVVGDYYGVDIMAQNYLMDILMLEPERVTVYHMFDSPRNINPKITQTVGGFKSDDERDTAMTNASFEDIALVRTNKKLSGTAENILRRYLLTTIS